MLSFVWGLSRIYEIFSVYLVSTFFNDLSPDFIYYCVNRDSSLEHVYIHFSVKQVEWLIATMSDIGSRVLKNSLKFVCSKINWIKMARKPSGHMTINWKYSCLIYQILNVLDNYFTCNNL